jgi:putative hydrolase of the HAD superfamily
LESKPKPEIRSVKAVIFDMDNTLFDFVEAKIRACKAVCDHLGMDDERELLNYFLRRKHDFESYENIADYLKDKGIYNDKLFEECCKIYEEVKLATIKPYPDVKYVLEKLKKAGLKLAVVTDALNGNATKRLKKAGLFEYFDVIVSADQSGKRKPEPDSIILALEKLGVKPEEAILVGDSIRRDIEAGKKLRMVTVYAAYGDRNFFESKVGKADFVLKDLKEIIDYLRVVGCMKI